MGVACFRGADVLLIRRGTPPLIGDWSLPGGRIEFGERAHEAALRELGEETRVCARLIGLIDVVDAIFTSRRSGETVRHYLLADYAAGWERGEPIAGDDADDAMFVSPRALAEIEIWPETRRIIEAARRMAANA